MQCQKFGQIHTIMLNLLLGFSPILFLMVWGKLTFVSPFPNFLRTLLLSDFDRVWHSTSSSGLHWFSSCCDAKDDMLVFAFSFILFSARELFPSFVKLVVGWDSSSSFYDTFDMDLFLRRPVEAGPRFFPSLTGVEFIGSFFFVMSLKLPPSFAGVVNGAEKIVFINNVQLTINCSTCSLIYS